MLEKLGINTAIEKLSKEVENEIKEQFNNEKKDYYLGTFLLL